MDAATSCPCILVYASTCNCMKRDAACSTRRPLLIMASSADLLALSDSTPTRNFSM